MGRTRTKAEKSKIHTVDTASTPNRKEPSISALLAKTQTLIEQSDYGLGLEFAQRILQKEPKHAEAREMLGVCYLELGEIEKAREAFLTLIPPHPDAPSPPPTSAYLYLAQLGEDDPHASLSYYQSAIDVLSGQLKGKERENGTEAVDEREVKNSIVRAYVGMVEIWMDPSYDLCFDPAVETTCEQLLERALQTDPGNPEALQALASVRMSQQRPEDATQCLEQAWAPWKDLDLDDPRIPPLDTRLALVKLFLELSLYSAALLVLQGIMASDDQVVEAWYLEGWCFFLMAENAKESGSTIEGLTWEQLAKDARDCLETCLMLHLNEDHPDKPMLEHVREVIGQLDALGIKASAPDEDDEDVDEDGEWEDASDNDDAMES